MGRKNKKDKVSLKEIRQTFYDLRSFEISNLWQRSVFLSAILVVLLAGYGGLVIKMLECSDRWADWKWHLACCILSCFGIIFSAIWTVMAKGSKAWYEVYEGKIRDIEKDMLKGKHMPRLCYEMKNNPVKDLDMSLHTCNAGKFSVSKINILIGQIVGTIFIALFSVHTVLLLCNLLTTLKFNLCLIVFLCLAALVALYGLGYLLISYLKHEAESSSLSRYKEK